MTDTAARTLDSQRAEFKRNRFLAMPLAGLLVWTLLLIPGGLLPLPQSMLALFIGTACAMPWKNRS